MGGWATKYLNLNICLSQTPKPNINKSKQSDMIQKIDPTVANRECPGQQGSHK